MKRGLLSLLLGSFLANVAPASALKQRSKRPPKAWLLKLLQERHLDGARRHVNGTVNKTGVYSLDDSHCAQICRLQTVDPTYQRECIAQCRTETDTDAVGSEGGSQKALRRFAGQHSPGTQKAYGEIFGEALSPPCRRTLQPRAGAALGAVGAGDLAITFAEADTDGDGGVSKDELQDLAKRLCVQGGALQDVMEKRDSNLDQKLEKGEWDAAVRDVVLNFELYRFREQHFVAEPSDGTPPVPASQRFKQLDIDDNGKLEDFELGAGFVADIMDRYANAGTDTEDAAAEMFWDHLDQIMAMFDKNSDGVVSLEEFNAAEGNADDAGANATSGDNSTAAANVSLLAAARPYGVSHKAAEAVTAARGKEKPFGSEKQQKHMKEKEAEAAVKNAVEQLHASITAAVTSATSKAAQATAAVGSVAQATHLAVFGGDSAVPLPASGSQQLRGSKNETAPDAASLHVHAVHKAVDAVSHALKGAKSALAGTDNPEADPIFQKQVEEAWAEVKASTSLDDIEDVADSDYDESA